MHAEVQLITPELAQEWLTNNPHNRQIQIRYVDKLVSAISNGEWKLNGEAIKFNGDGSILDGQHRLMAVIKSGLPIYSLVITGLSRGSQDTMDLGRSRSLSDLLRMEGVANYAAISAIVNMTGIVQGMWNAQERGLLGSHVNAETIATQLRRYMDDAERFDAALRSSRAMSLTIKWSATPIGAVAYFAIADHADEWDYFAESVASGANLAPGDPALALRQAALMRRPQHRQTINRLWAFALCAKAWNAFVSESQIKNLKWRLNGTKREQLPTVI